MPKHSVDPTGTNPIASRWRLEMRVRVRKFEQRCASLVKVTDGLGISHAHFKVQFERTIVGDPENPWYAKFVRAAYKNGLDRAAKKLGKETPAELTATQENVLDFIIGKAGDSLETISFDATGRMSANVALTGEPDAALTIVAQECRLIETRVNLLIAVFTVAAHAEATLDYFKANGVKRVGLDVEAIPHKHVSKMTADEKVQWETAGDDKVCPKCKDMEGLVFDIEDAYGLIPLHPNCRCDWLALPDDSEGDVDEDLPGESIDRTLKLLRFVTGR